MEQVPGREKGREERREEGLGREEEREGKRKSAWERKREGGRGSEREKREKGGGLTNTVLGVQCRSFVQCPLELFHFVSLHTK